MLIGIVIINGVEENDFQLITSDFSTLQGSHMAGFDPALAVHVKKEVLSTDEVPPPGPLGTHMHEGGASQQPPSSQTIGYQWQGTLNYPSHYSVQQSSDSNSQIMMMQNSQFHNLNYQPESTITAFWNVNSQLQGTENQQQIPYNMSHRINNYSQQINFPADGMIDRNLGMNYEPRNMGMNYEPGNMGMNYEPRNTGMNYEPRNMGMNYEPRNMGMNYEPRSACNGFQGGNYQKQKVYVNNSMHHPQQ